MSTAARRLFFFFILVVYPLMVLAYAWQKNRGFSEYVRCMGYWKRKSRCLYVCFVVLLFPWAALCRCTLYCFHRLCDPCYGWFDRRAQAACPEQWAAAKRCYQHVMGTCWYMGTRVVVVADCSIESSVVKRVEHGRSPAYLKQTAKKQIEAWSADELEKSVNTLEECSKYIDYGMSPFTELRRLVEDELARQIAEVLQRDPKDYDSEAQLFLARADMNFGKEAMDVDMFTRARFFAGAGPMESIIRLLELLQKAGGSLKSTPFKPLRPVIEAAAKERLAWALKQGAHKPLRYALFCASALQVTTMWEYKDAGETYKRLRQLPKEWDINAMLNEQYGCRMLAKKQLGGTMMGVAPLPGSEADKIQKLLDDTYVDKYTKDRRGGQVPQRLVLVAATYVQNDMNWSEYLMSPSERSCKPIPCRATRSPGPRPCSRPPSSSWRIWTQRCRSAGCGTARARPGPKASPPRISV